MTVTSSDATQGTNGTALQYNQLRADVVRGLKNLVTETDGATVDFDLETSNVQTVTLEGNRTLSLSNPADHQIFTVILKQDAVGSRTVTWWSGIVWVNGTEPTLTTTASKRDVFTFIVESTGVYLGFISGQNI